jgi:PAS domain S-box-containing protein
MTELAEQTIATLTRELAEAKAQLVALEHSLEAHRRLLENARDMVWRTDLDGKVQYVNAYAEEFLERSAAEVLGHTMNAYFTEESARTVAKGVRATLFAKPPQPFFQCEVEYLHKDGYLVSAEARITAERDAAGRVVAFSGISRSIADRKKAEALAASLAQQDRLASMGMLAAGVAHEINNPLAYVLASIEVLAAGLPTVACIAEHTDLLDAAAAALDGTRRIAGIARGLSTFAHVERMECTHVELRHAIESAATMAHNEIKYRATLVRDYAELPTLWASEGKLSQVFLNLLVNAAHAMPEGDAGAHRITIRTWAEGDSVFAEVRDTGAGIAPEHLGRIFEPFFTTKKAGRGSGLGLAICRTLLAEFGGDLRIESELGRGTRAIVSLPVGLAPAVDEAALAAAKAESDRPVARGRVLVVDDEEHIRSVLQRMLRAEHEVVAVASGREAQALLQRDAAFDVVLCDLMMPDLAGTELHAWMVGHEPALAKKVVFVSGGAFTPEVSEYLASVDCLQVPKPFEYDALRTLVRVLVGRARAGG